MVASANYVASDMQGFKVAYIQSDEATFCITDYDDINTQGWFDYDISKIISITSCLMTVAFNRFYTNLKWSKNTLDYNREEKYSIFDCRAFNVPKEDVVNAFLWRAKDWNRNSIQMYARSLFSHKQLHKKNIKEILLHKIGKNWTTDLTETQRNGTFLIIDKEDKYIQNRSDILPTYGSINKAIGHLF